VDLVSRWLHEPLPEARAAVFRVLAYLFVPLDVLWAHTSGEYHGYADPAFYQPLLIGRLLPLPVPTYEVVQACKWGVVVAAVVLAGLCVLGRYSQALGWVVFALYLEYQVIAFSYGKVDHDRFAYLVALAVLPTLGAVRLRSVRVSEAAGWALRCVQLAVVATYFYAAIAKIRFGGSGWVDSGTIARAVIRRGTDLAEPLLAVPWTLRATQWFVMAMELSAPLVFLLSERWRWRVVAFWLSFHAVTYAMITIVFLPHVLSLLAFLPLERLVRREVAARAPRLIMFGG
jgi:hypothetical protein